MTDQMGPNLKKLSMKRGDGTGTNKRTIWYFNSFGPFGIYNLRQCFMKLIKNEA